MTTPDPLDPERMVHDCNDDPGLIHSYFAAMAFLVIAEECRAEHCKVRARAEQALKQPSSGDGLPRICDAGLDEKYSQRIYDRVTARAAWEASVDHAFCRLDPGHLDREQARILLRHRQCAQERCRLKLRGLQAFAPNRYRCPPPQCRVPDQDIAAAVADYQGTRWVLEAVKAALSVRQPESLSAMAAATAEFAAAHRRRDALFLRALPTDGTIPAMLIRKFRISYFEMHRLIPTFMRPLQV
ncbi:hypothetical protein ACFVAV_30935 [Nocardia sp. NPDC057663]|uniref:hypothetical protein n=1 Tax=Nocardia sp. NPDC057663 TaxID=3346201 RepID=UPI00366A7819